jgi:hypothetical protein
MAEESQDCKHGNKQHIEKVKQAVLMACIANAISQSSPDFFPIWIPFICEGGSKLLDRSV